jgi:hypothetical protein
VNVTVVSPRHSTAFSIISLVGGMRILLSKVRQAVSLPKAWQLNHRFVSRDRRQAGSLPDSVFMTEPMTKSVWIARGMADCWTGAHWQGKSPPVLIYYLNL